MQARAAAGNFIIFEVCKKRIRFAGINNNFNSVDCLSRKKTNRNKNGKY